jgi:hypothetical protein
MQEQNFQKGKECIVDSNLEGLQSLIESGFNVDTTSSKEPYSLMGYFLMFSQNFERREVGQLIYDHSTQDFNSKELLFLGFILLNRSIVEKATKTNSNAKNIEQRIRLSDCKNWGKNVSLEVKSFWADVTPSLNIHAFTNLEILELATRIKNLDLIKLCAESRVATGAGLDTVLNIREDALLHIPAGMGCAESTEILINLGANINIANKYQWTPLHFATRYGHTETVRLLVNRKADLSLTTSDQSTALDIATKHSQRAIIEILSHAEAI